MAAGSHQVWRGSPMKEPDSKDDYFDAGAPERTEEPTHRHPSRLLVFSIALTVGTVVAGLVVLSRTDASVRVPDFIGKPADPVGDNLVFMADTVGLTVDVIIVIDCRARDANIVLNQTPAPGTRVPAGTAVVVHVCRNPDAETVR